MTQSAPHVVATGPAAPRPSAPAPRGVLPREAVRVVAQPALIDCGGGEQGKTLTVVPLMDGDRVAGLEVRCSCGATTMIECVYSPETGK